MPKRTILILFTAGFMLLLILAACGSGGEDEDEPAPGMANPASVYCEQAGWTLEIRDTDAGQVGMCSFEDGTECEEWAFFRGECGLEYTFCEQLGFTPEVRDGVLTCVFADGTSCPESEFASDTCEPGQ